MNITLQEYASLKRQIIAELEDAKREVKDLFNGDMFNRDIYETLNQSERQLYSQLVHIMDNLKGQLDAFERLEGNNSTELNKLLRYKNIIAEQIK